MKTKQITTSKATILVVDASDFTKKDMRAWDINPEWQHLGQLYDITEEQWREVVDGTKDSYGRYYMFENYEYSKHPFDNKDLLTAKESVLSLLKANGVVLENMFGTYEENITSGDASVSFRNWMEENENVWQNVHIFIKK